MWVHTLLSVELPPFCGPSEGVAVQPSWTKFGGGGVGMAKEVVTTFSTVWIAFEAAASVYQMIIAVYLSRRSSLQKLLSCVLCLSVKPYSLSSVQFSFSGTMTW